MSNSNRNILLLVEGRKREVQLFKKMLEAFPEIGISPENIISFETNIWVLYGKLIKEFGQDWYTQGIDFLTFLQNPSIGMNLNGKAFSDIYLVFDYERQDSNFSDIGLEHMMSFFNNSTENGLLFINYPMVESYKHIKDFPDYDYLTRKCNFADIKEYKKTVGEYSAFNHLTCLDSSFFKEVVKYNLCKCSLITKKISQSNYEMIYDNGQVRNITNELIYQIASEYWFKMDYQEILKLQNSNSNNYIYVLCTRWPNSLVTHSLLSLIFSFLSISF